MTFSSEILAELSIVFDDSVVDDGQAGPAVDVGVRLAAAAPTRWSSGEKSARSPHREGNRPAVEPENTENPDANPARDPREPRALPSFMSVASFFGGALLSIKFVIAFP